MAKKILIVDDEPSLVMLVSARLKTHGYEVISAGDGQTGLDMAKKEKPDLIILDLMLPKMDGYKVCGLLKKDTRYSKISIILFSARDQEEDKIQGMELGANAYIAKPFTPQILLEIIEEWTKGGQNG